MYSVLVVDDHAAWRNHVCSEVQKSARWRVAGEASDGLEAVRQAQALDPDLILLDIGLPTLNGLESARRIRAQNPAAIILFLSEYRSWDIADAAFATGARGYLCKANTAGRLLPAMDAIHGGVRFVSAGLGGDVVQKTLCDALPQVTSHHVAGFYADETSLLDDYFRFAECALEAGNTFVLLADSARRDRLLEKLQAGGVDVDRVRSEGRFMAMDILAELSTCMVDGLPDEGRFRAAAAALVTGAARTSKAGDRRVALIGEGAPRLWQDGRTEAAICIERVWNELSRTCAVDSLCAYSADTLPHDDSREAFQRICTEHSAVHFRRDGRVA